MAVQYPHYARVCTLLPLLSETFDPETSSLPKARKRRCDFTFRAFATAVETWLPTLSERLRCVVLPEEGLWVEYFETGMFFQADPDGSLRVLQFVDSDRGILADGARDMERNQPESHYGNCTLFGLRLAPKTIRFDPDGAFTAESQITAVTYLKRSKIQKSWPPAAPPDDETLTLINEAGRFQAAVTLALFLNLEALPVIRNADGDLRLPSLLDVLTETIPQMPEDFPGDYLLGLLPEAPQAMFPKQTAALVERWHTAAGRIQTQQLPGPGCLWIEMPDRGVFLIDEEDERYFLEISRSRLCDIEDQAGSENVIVTFGRWQITDNLVVMPALAVAFRDGTVTRQITEADVFWEVMNDNTQKTLETALAGLAWLQVEGSVPEAGAGPVQIWPPTVMTPAQTPLQERFLGLLPAITTVDPELMANAPDVRKATVITCDFAHSVLTDTNRNNALFQDYGKQFALHGGMIWIEDSVSGILALDLEGGEMVPQGLDHRRLLFELRPEGPERFTLIIGCVERFVFVPAQKLQYEVDYRLLASYSIEDGQTRITWQPKDHMVEDENRLIDGSCERFITLLTTLLLAEAGHLETSMIDVNRWQFRAPADSDLATAVVDVNRWQLQTPADLDLRTETRLIGDDFVRMIERTRKAWDLSTVRKTAPAPLAWSTPPTRKDAVTAILEATRNWWRGDRRIIYRVLSAAAQRFVQSGPDLFPATPPACWHGRTLVVDSGNRRLFGQTRQMILYYCQVDDEESVFIHLNIENLGIISIPVLAGEIPSVEALHRRGRTPSAETLERILKSIRFAMALSAEIQRKQVKLIPGPLKKNRRGKVVRKKNRTVPLWYYAELK